jgi:tetratricopeptide (TPR) repeat protein
MTGNRHWLLGAILLSFWVLGGSPVFSQSDPAAAPDGPPSETRSSSERRESDEDFDAPPRPLYLQQPFDLITVKGDGSQHRILPLDIPVRKITPQSSGSLRVRLERDPAEERSIRWGNIERIDLYEDMVLAEAKQLTRQRRYDEAFRSFAFLQDRYPEVEGLESTIQDFLFVNAGNYVSQNRYPEALSTLEELYSRNREYVSGGGRGVTSALSSVVGVLLKRYIDQEDYPLARSSLRQFEQRFGDARLPALSEARRRLNELAGKKGMEVRQLLDQQQWREAEMRAREMLRIWPELEGGAELAREALRRYSIVPVAVTQRAYELDVSSTTDWAARRAGRLVGRELVELQGPGPEGGRYTSPLGTIERSDDYQQLTFQIGGGQSSSSQLPVTGYDISARLLELADIHDPHYVPQWAEIFQGVRVTGALRVEARLRRPHVIPEAFLQVPLFYPENEPEWARSLIPYEIAERSDEGIRFTRRDRSDTESHVAPAEIREVFFEESSDAVAALKRGDVFLMDRMLPGEAARLAQDETNQTVLIGSYALPTIHMIVPNANNPYLNTPAFRRAILHAIPRELILDRLLEGRSMAGCRIVTGPFPAGRSADDPMGYAYDRRLAQRPFDPGVAMLLFRMAESQLRQAAEKNDEEPPELKPLVLAHPEDAIARFACTMIAAQLNTLQIPCVLKQLPAGRVTDTSETWDLLYMAMTVGEPIFDAERLLARGGWLALRVPTLAWHCADCGKLARGVKREIDSWNCINWCTRKSP